MSVSVIPDRFRPKFCSQCGSRIVPGEKPNQFLCEGGHEHWIQSPQVAYVVLLDEHNQTYLTERGIPPAIGGLCFPGGYVDFGDTVEETVVHETLDEACIRIEGCHAIYLGQWYESGPGITVTGILVHIQAKHIDEFVPSTESTGRRAVPFWDFDPDVLAFKGNRLALFEARKRVFQEIAFEHP